MKPKSIFRSLQRAVRRPFYRRPRIVMTLLCRDEEDIIGYNITYHLAQGVDFVIATDNASRDRTPPLLQRFVQQGKLKLIREPRLTHDQSVWVTRMARMAATRYDADWVINNDADEFWLSRQGTLRETLEAVPSGTDCLIVPRLDMPPPQDAERKFFEAMLIYAADSRTVHGMPELPKTCHRAHPDILVADGNHGVTLPGAHLVERSDHPPQILHFPLRNAAQFDRKIRQGAEALERNARIKKVIGAHWRWLYRDYFPTGRLAEYYSARADVRADRGRARKRRFRPRHARPRCAAAARPVFG
ncbi:MAG: glycosyltransferase family 2 protein, partial [Dongiaceae bacterium]